MEEIAQTTPYTNNLPYHEVQSALVNAVLEKYPTTNTGAIPKIIWDPQRTPREFLAKQKNNGCQKQAYIQARRKSTERGFVQQCWQGCPNKLKLI